jgi:hypothetical protein
MGIAGVKPEPVPEPKSSEVAATSTSVSTPSPVAASSAVPIVAPSTTAVAQASPKDGKDGGESKCNLLGDFALFVQGALGLLAVSSLAVKRLREHPRRPLKIWFFDVSKQVFGSVLLHLANVLMSMLSSGQFDVLSEAQATALPAAASDDGAQPNPCSFYLLNLAIDVRILPFLPISNTNTDTHRPLLVFQFSLFSSSSSTAPSYSLLSLSPRSRFALATTANHLAAPGG